MIRVLAPAKINLFLHVTGKRADGYHDLQSLIFFADIGDQLTIAPAAQDKLVASGPFAHALPQAEQNLVTQAMIRMRKQYPELPGVTIHLDKQLPVAAGIGGGSSDAAAVLRAIAILYNLQPTQEILLELGSEMPVCYGAAAAWVQGRGERVESWSEELPDWGVLLVNPGKALPTKQVFAEIDCFSPLYDFTQPTDWRAVMEKTANDLTIPAMKLLPEIATVIEKIADQQGCLLARMSGSGATCFGLFKNRQAAAQAASTIASAAPHWWVKSGGIYTQTT